MSRVAVSRVIDAPVSAVWEILTDPSWRASGLPGGAEIRVLTPGEFGIGTRWRETRHKPGGVTLTEELVVTAIQPGQSYTIGLSGAPESNQLTYLLASVQIGAHRGGTAVTVVAERRPHGFANRLLAFLVGSFAARTAEGALRDELSALARRCLTPAIAAGGEAA